MSRSDKGVRWCEKRSGFDIANGKSPLAGSGAAPRLNSYFVDADIATTRFETF